MKRLAVIGCGLMGGSFALAARAAGLVDHVIAYGRSRAPLDWAIANGVIDAAAGSAAEATAGADVLLLAMPVGASDTVLAEIAGALTPNALLMDVGSTKRQVIAAARQALGPRLPCFVPAHPIAGKERAGVQAADAALYRGRPVVLTPLPETAPAQLQQARAVWQALGSRVQEMSPQAHDEAYAAVSHLPHLIAYAYVAGLLTQAERDAYLALAGPGFRDFTRIAASEPTMWRDVLLSNADEVLAQLTHFRTALSALEDALRAPDAPALEDIVRRASNARAAWHLSGDASSDPSAPVG